MSLKLFDNRAEYIYTFNTGTCVVHQVTRAVIPESNIKKKLSSGLTRILNCKGRWRADRPVKRTHRTAGNREVRY